MTCPAPLTNSSRHDKASQHCGCVSGVASSPVEAASGPCATRLCAVVATCPALLASAQGVGLCLGLVSVFQSNLTSGHILRGGSHVPGKGWFGLILLGINQMSTLSVNGREGGPRTPQDYTTLFYLGYTCNNNPQQQKQTQCACHYLANHVHMRTTPKPKGLKHSASCPVGCVCKGRTALWCMPHLLPTRQLATHPASQ